MVTGNKLVGYKKLTAWKLADELAWSVYKLSDRFPKYELYGMTSQLRRAAISVVLNIVEGHSRNNKKEFRVFLRISLGSLSEVEYLLDFAYRRKYIIKKDFNEISSLKESCGRVLWKLMKSQY